jgi:NitT/TauT family transport system ATP-binding protein
MNAAGLTTGASVSVHGVTKTFRARGREVEALRGVDLDIEKGEFVSLLGPSGCGKSTLLRIIGGLIDPDNGVVTVDDTTPHKARSRKQFGLIPQAPALVPWRTVEDNVLLLDTLNHRAKQTTLPTSEIDDLIDAVGLTDFRQSYPHELSGGMQQRVSLVRGFALGAPVLLMDEPFAALDEITRGDARYLLLDLWSRTGATVIFVTHSIPEAVILSDRVVVMAARPGRVAAVERIALERPRRPDVEDEPVFHEHVRQLRVHLRDHHR